MRHDASFAEMLDAHLGCTDVPPPPRVWSTRPLTAPLFTFELPLTAGGRPAGLTARGHAPAEPPRPVRLSAEERHTLDDAPSLDALRRAYRTLARRYHPDQHQACGPGERERLARLFAEATERYHLRRRRV
jgi:hypothetical protein